MVIKDAAVLTPEFELRPKTIAVNKDKFTDSACGETISFPGCYILPGFIDTHFHGAMGEYLSYADEEKFKKILNYCASTGTTTVTPTTMTDSIENLKNSIARIKKAAEKRAAGLFGGAKIGGIHLEGPFISKAFKGAQNPVFITEPTEERINDLLSCFGRELIKIITMAPEADGACRAAEILKSRGITVSAGHTAADEQQMMRGIDYDFTRMTHTFNAMAPFLHRNPGALGAALTDGRVVNEIICDFLHVSKTAVKLLFSVKDINGVCIISDSIPLCGMPDGEYKNLNGRGIYYTKKDGIIKLKDGTIAGGSFSVLYGVKNCLNAGIDFKKVMAAATINPARALGIDGTAGSIESGKQADFIVTDKHFNLLYTFIDGKMAYKAENA